MASPILHCIFVISTTILTDSIAQPATDSPSPKTPSPIPLPPSPSGAPVNAPYPYSISVGRQHASSFFSSAVESKLRQPQQPQAETELRTPLERSSLTEDLRDGFDIVDTIYIIEGGLFPDELRDHRRPDPTSAAAQPQLMDLLHNHRSNAQSRVHNAATFVAAKSKLDTMLLPQ
ncbi:hydroxyproline-rich glycoprotein family protein [Prunus dulcis]|uniref:Hydroxyproline-rich glycoprotein family protein n=1 Tax=Prunus dulcis TaxID=3755 RepID=A0A4Y1R8C1_PRUDU|nr:hydroxyproline-rich glycoprotein family protein [Prunus dulcis]